ncbi:hypothetical protein V6N11_029725 [Hibiscus sabdariffa]|uniref:Uncharacterized protein n=1 Tax=Hibiscus sabdariffa TaxID=183260 RepID=A0ABR2P7K4_9ROSI
MVLILSVNTLSDIRIRYREFGVVAYSPLGRWFFSSGPKLVETFSDGDFRKFRGSNLKTLTTTNTCSSGSMRWLREKGAAHHSLH